MNPDLMMASATGVMFNISIRDGPVTFRFGLEVIEGIDVRVLY
jgi:hypothetical protein